MFGLAGVAVGILLFIIGIFLVFFFPANAEHQPSSFSLVGVILGFILLIIGGLLIFLP
ncbi:MAG: hypothetical protein ABIH52_04090 [Candidatus Aenigmatarchaeota archaeon]